MYRKIAFITILLTSLCAGAQQSLTGHFAWGAEVGGSIDMTSNDMSTINANAFFGYRNSWIDALGAGAGINVTVNNNCRMFPIYALFRTSFTSRPSLLFMDLRVGTAVNSVDSHASHARFYCAPGIGFNLARSNKFCSYITLSYQYNGMKYYMKEDVRHNISSLSLASVQLGICF